MENVISYCSLFITHFVLVFVQLCISSKCLVKQTIQLPVYVNNDRFINKFIILSISRTIYTRRSNVSYKAGEGKASAVYILYFISRFTQHKTLMMSKSVYIIVIQSLPQFFSPTLENFSIYSNKFFHNFHLSESNFTYPGLRASGLALGLVMTFL